MFVRSLLENFFLVMIGSNSEFFHVCSWLDNFSVMTGSNGELFHYVLFIMKKVTFSRFSCQNCRKFCLTFDEVILSRFSSSLSPSPSSSLSSVSSTSSNFFKVDCSWPKYSRSELKERECYRKSIDLWNILGFPKIFYG